MNKFINPNIIVAIDGPAGAGKGTLANRLAEHYRLKYLDTGTLYRAVALRVLAAGGDPAHEADAIAAASGFDFDFKHLGNNVFGAFLDGEEIMVKLRTPEVGQGASKVAFFPEVRRLLKAFQVDFAAEWKAKVGIVLDGRDIGTAICPGAEIKFFVDASADVRAGRRFAELQAKGVNVTLAETLAEVLERDARDRGRKEAPLRPADDAIMIDTSEKDADEVFACACAKIDELLAK